MNVHSEEVCGNRLGWTSDGTRLTGGDSRDETQECAKEDVYASQLYGIRILTRMCPPDALRDCALAIERRKPERSSAVASVDQCLGIGFQAGETLLH